MPGIDTSSRAKLLGNGGAMAGFVVMVVLEFAHPAYGEWTRATDMALFAGSRRHPTGGLCAVAVALVAGSAGYLVGHAIDRRS